MPWGDCTGPWWAQGGKNPRRGWGWGWFRSLFGGGPPWAQSMPNFNEQDEKAYLKSQENWLKSRLDAIRQRLRELEEE